MRRSHSVQITATALVVALAAMASACSPGDGTASQVPAASVSASAGDPVPEATGSPAPSGSQRTPPAATDTPVPQVTPPLKLKTRPGEGEPGFRQIAVAVSNSPRSVTPNVLEAYPSGVPVTTGIPVKLLTTFDFNGYTRVEGYGIKETSVAGVKPQDIQFYANKAGTFNVWAGQAGSAYGEILLYRLKVCATCTP